MKDVMRIPGSENPEILLETSLQLEKDFSRSALELVLSDQEKGNMDQLHQRISLELARLCREEPEKLRQLIYTIDIPEKNPLLAQGCDQIADLAGLLIHRELYKVVHRKLYRS